MLNFKDSTVLETRYRENPYACRRRRRDKVTGSQYTTYEILADGCFEEMAYVILSELAMLNHSHVRLAQLKVPDIFIFDKQFLTKTGATSAWNHNIGAEVHMNAGALVIPIFSKGKRLMEIDYGIEQLSGIPSEFTSRGVRLDYVEPTKFGKYCLVGIEDSSEEQHHQVDVIDESGDPLKGVIVVWGYPGGGPDLGLSPSISYWPLAPAVLRGDSEVTGQDGSVKHVVKSGGEDCWIWDLDERRALKCSSDIVRNLQWISTPKNQHTCIKLTFQRRLAGVMPKQQQDKLNMLRLAALESELLAVREIAEKTASDLVEIKAKLLELH